MLNYRLPSGLPAGSRATWSRLYLLPFSTRPLTPFSYSILAEITGRAWFQYYDALGFDPMPRARVVRRHDGCAYLNLAFSAQREAEHTASEPVTFILNGAAFPVTKVEKTGFLGGIRAGRNERKIERLHAALAGEMGTMAAEARAWYAKVSDFRWTQAEILMAMEEIEPISTRPFMAFLGARQGLLLALNRLMRMANQPPAETLRQIDRGLGGSEGVVEARMVRRLAEMAARATPGSLAPLAAESAPGAAGAPGAWEEKLAATGLVDEMRAFLTEYGHHATSPGEVAEPRWAESPEPLLRALANPSLGQAPGEEDALNLLLAKVAAGDRRRAQEEINTLRQLIPLQSQALDVLSLILAGTRKWAWGAAREAMEDNRLLATDDVYYFELEELKEMMTGEWNISDRAGIQNTAVKRKVQYAAWRGVEAPDLLIGDAPAETLDRVDPSVVLQPALYFPSAAAEKSPA